MTKDPKAFRKDQVHDSSVMFQEYAKSIGDNAKRECKTLVVANPTNTNCLICCHNANGMQKSHFSALSRLEHNRVKSMLAIKTESLICDISQVAVWGNCSQTIYPDIRNALIKDKKVSDMVDKKWIEDEFIPAV